MSTSLRAHSQCDEAQDAQQSDSEPASVSNTVSVSNTNTERVFRIPRRIPRRPRRIIRRRRILRKRRIRTQGGENEATLLSPDEEQRMLRFYEVRTFDVRDWDGVAREIILPLLIAILPIFGCRNLQQSIDKRVEVMKDLRKQHFALEYY
ncbi:hypothetical protein BDR26DRAFT_875768 [Obelidium mucronatum]|nr:hypothetical protein BDR26DRAFT_875768 [Obelidium mucronatum]